MEMQSGFFVGKMPLLSRAAMHRNASQRTRQRHTKGTLEFFEDGNAMNQENELLTSANQRIEVPKDYLSLNYSESKKLLAVRLSDKKTSYSKIDMEKGIIFDYDSSHILTNIEILDFLFVKSEEPESFQSIQQLETAALKNPHPKSKKRFCNKCGKPKHTVCLDHHNFKKKGFEKAYSVVRRYSRKFYFILATRIGLAN